LTVFPSNSIDSIYDPSENLQNYLDLPNIKRGQWSCIREVCLTDHKYLEYIPKNQCTRYLLVNTTYSKHKYNDKEDIKHYKTTIVDNKNLKFGNRYGHWRCRSEVSQHGKKQEFSCDNTRVTIHDKFIELTKTENSASFIESIELDGKTVKLIFHF